MNKQDFRIVFMGTPDFAVRILDELIQQAFNVVGVITAPDKPAGRGQQINESAVKKYAVEKELNILQPTNLKDEAFIQELSDLKADLFVVVAFRMLPEVVWAMPPKGTINLHASILPNYRGAAPINWAVMNGEAQTGVTTFFIEKEIDTGKVIERSYVTIGENESVGELHDRLMELGAQVSASTVQKIMDETAVGIDQLELADASTSSATKKELKSAPKIFKPTCEIDWKQSVATVHNFVRGLSPYPAAWTTLTNNTKNETKTFKVFAATKTDLTISDATTLKETKEGILFPCGDCYLLVSELQPEGKRRMNYKEFLAGNKIEEWKLV
ncbi:MAG: Methionyl-tRNA formyltransferase [Bacteroidota bacterium]|jgi:methionyl-tRNA formyltransferase